MNRQEHYVDPDTGAHTQRVERSWLDAKISIMKKERGVPQLTLESHLDFYCLADVKKGWGWPLLHVTFWNHNFHKFWTIFLMKPHSKFIFGRRVRWPPRHVSWVMLTTLRTLQQYCFIEFKHMHSYIEYISTSMAPWALCSKIIYWFDDLWETHKALVSRFRSRSFVCVKMSWNISSFSNITHYLECTICRIVYLQTWKSSNK